MRNETKVTLNSFVVPVAYNVEKDSKANVCR